jgi:proline dehydrogenase
VTTLVRGGAANADVASFSLEHARAVCDRLAREGIAGVVCYWDVYAYRPKTVSQASVGLLGALKDVPTDCYLSVKAPALKFDIQLLKRVLEEAQRLNAIVHFDALSPDTVDRTFELIYQARSFYPKLACTLPGRWRRTMTDADRAIEMELRVRVVKGEWKAIDDDETDPLEGFLNIIERLRGRATHVAVATHNATLARISLRRLKNAGTPCELELLYGLPQQPLLEIAKNFGVRARMYVPYGHSGLRG